MSPQYHIYTFSPEASSVNQNFIPNICASVLSVCFSWKRVFTDNVHAFCVLTKMNIVFNLMCFDRILLTPKPSVPKCTVKHFKRCTTDSVTTRVWRWHTQLFQAISILSQLRICQYHYLFLKHEHAHTHTHTHPHTHTHAVFLLLLSVCTWNWKSEKRQREPPLFTTLPEKWSPLAHIQCSTTQ